MSAQLDGEQIAKLREFFDARKAATAWKNQAEKLRDELAESIDLNSPDSYANTDGEYVGRVRHVPGKRFDVKRLRSERPDIYAEFESETNQIRIEEPS